MDSQTYSAPCLVRSRDTPRREAKTWSGNPFAGRVSKGRVQGEMRVDEGPTSCNGVKPQQDGLNRDATPMPTEIFLMHVGDASFSPLPRKQSRLRGPTELWLLLEGFDLQSWNVSLVIAYAAATGTYNSRFIVHGAFHPLAPCRSSEH